MNNATVRENIRRFLRLDLVNAPVDCEIQEEEPRADHTRYRIQYAAAEGGTIPAFLLIPKGSGHFPAVLIHHQHAGQRHLGKSEVVGIAGDPLQAFAPDLATRGFVVLAPDSICFEDRRRHTSGIHPHERDDIEHFIEMGMRLTQRDTLMRKVLSDASSALSLLVHHPQVDASKIGVLGHSYGGNTTLFQAALDPRLAFSVASGALCSYAYKRQHHIALEMALIIPGFAERWDLHHLLECLAPRPALIVSAEDDPYSADAPEVITRAHPNDHITHLRDAGGHSLTPERFARIVSFISECVNPVG